MQSPPERLHYVLGTLEFSLPFFSFVFSFAAVMMIMIYPKYVSRRD